VLAQVPLLAPVGVTTVAKALKGSFQVPKYLDYKKELIKALANKYL
jgi:hypothetical protein